MLNLEKLKASLKAHEGYRLKPYTDTTGNTTIGVGRNLTANGVSDDEIELMLNNDIALSQTGCEQQVWWPNVENDDVRARALIEIVFNLGIGGLLTFNHAVSALAAGDFSTAADEFLNSLWAKQVGHRAIILTQMLRNGWDISPIDA